MRIQAIGICRFSMLTGGGFKHGPKDDLRERAEYLFDPKRLAIRMAWFRHVALRSVSQQQDKDFTFVVLTSEDLPEPWLTQLHEAIAEVPQACLEVTPAGKHADLCNNAIVRRIEPGTDLVAQFRLDDDDALATDYVTRIRGDYHRFLAPICQDNEAVSADYVRGFVLEADAHTANIVQTNALAWTCAQTVYIRPGHRFGLFSWGHHRLHAVMPTITFCDSNMFLRGRHGVNDSAFRIPVLDTRPWDLGALRRRFGIRLEDLQQALRDNAAVA